MKKHNNTVFKPSCDCQAYLTTVAYHVTCYFKSICSTQCDQVTGAAVAMHAYAATGVSWSDSTTGYTVIARLGAPLEVRSVGPTLDKVVTYVDVVCKCSAGVTSTPCKRELDHVATADI